MNPLRSCVCAACLVVLAGCQSSKVPEGLPLETVEGFCPNAASLFVYRAPAPADGRRLWLCVDTKERVASPAFGKLDELRKRSRNEGRLFYPLDYAITSFDGSAGGVFVGVHDIDEIVGAIRTTMKDEPLAEIETREFGEQKGWRIVNQGRESYLASQEGTRLYWGRKSWQVPELVDVCAKAKYVDPFPDESMHLEIANLSAWLAKFQPKAWRALCTGANRVGGLDPQTLGKTLFTAKAGKEGIPVCELTVELPDESAAAALARNLDERLKARVAGLTRADVAKSLKARVQSGMTITSDKKTVRVQVKMFGLREPYWAGFGCLAVFAELADIGLPYEIDPR